MLRQPPQAGSAAGALDAACVGAAATAVALVAAAPLLAAGAGLAEDVPQPHATPEIAASKKKSARPRRMLRGRSHRSPARRTYSANAA
jgi:hypothetical protein